MPRETLVLLQGSFRLRHHHAVVNDLQGKSKVPYQIPRLSGWQTYRRSVGSIDKEELLRPEAEEFFDLARLSEELGVRA